ncbi:unnamed protein product [Adineta ricciae]|uniref:Uncharacterized protein n=2 Tax=Adineta ricciae TaxID=249248 RepID=A0A815MBL4_ADIRI|nr:unnamed protein product [Adineta ricciae]
MLVVFTFPIFLTLQLAKAGAINYVPLNGCQWSNCNVNDAIPPLANYSIDCCELKVPLNYAKTNGTKISISMTRLTPSNKNHTTNNTLFFLTGGPGSSGWTAIQYIPILFPAHYGITVILPDHRGVGLSTPLTCDDHGSQNLTIDCISYLTSKWSIDGLNQFSITSAAQDLSVQIHSYQSVSSGRVSVYSLSYGTIWLDRFLQIYPNMVQSAIMDGVMHPQLFSMSRYDLWTSLVASRFLGYCQFQPECNRYFPVHEPPQIMLARILKEVDQNNQPCINAHLLKYHITSDKLRGLFRGLMSSSRSFYSRTIIPAVIFRLNRCNSDDVKILNFFFKATLGRTEKLSESRSTPPPALYDSLVLGFNIIQSELWLGKDEEEVDEETLSAWHNSTLMALENFKLFTSLRSAWPKYPLDEYYHRIAINANVLMLSGQLDPATHLDYATHLATMTRKSRTFYTIPLVGHVAILTTLVDYKCPLKLICSWAFPNLFPSEWNDPNCIQEFPTAIDFVGNGEKEQEYSIMYLNISKPFEDINLTTPSSSNVRSISVYKFLTYFVLVFLTLFI